jgi:hypothetical protein
VTFLDCKYNIVMNSCLISKYCKYNNRKISLLNQANYLIARLEAYAETACLMLELHSLKVQVYKYTLSSYFALLPLREIILTSSHSHIFVNLKLLKESN